jgi:RNA polymerase sigma-70 factor (ECF subfamily)
VSNNIKSTDIDDKNLVINLKNRDERAYRQLVSRYQTKLKNVAYGITLDREESEDLVQDVFLKAFRGIENFKGDSSIYTWLRRITVNESLNWLRKWKRRFRWQHRSLEQDAEYNIEIASEEKGPENRYQEKQLSDSIKEGLDSLPEKSRAVLVLKEIEGLSYEEIGHLMGISKGTVSSRIFYAREKLREYLKGIESENEQ